MYAIPETKFARKYFPSAVENRISVLFFSEDIRIGSEKTNNNYIKSFFFFFPNICDIKI